MNRAESVERPGPYYNAPKLSRPFGRHTSDHAFEQCRQRTTPAAAAGSPPNALHRGKAIGGEDSQCTVRNPAAMPEEAKSENERA